MDKLIETFEKNVDLEEQEGYLLGDGLSRDEKVAQLKSSLV